MHTGHCLHVSLKGMTSVLMYYFSVFVPGHKLSLTLIG